MICIVSPFESKIGARGTRNIELSNLLIKNEYEVTFITSNFSHQIKSNYSTNDMYKKINDEQLINLVNMFDLNSVEYNQIKAEDKKPLDYIKLLMSKDRPDLTGAIPHFYTVSTIVSIIIPSRMIVGISNIYIVLLLSKIVTRKKHAK